MSQQDVQIAFQAGFVTYELEDYTEGGYDIRYERFADLIRADEREACADAVVQAVEKGLQAAIAMEREAIFNMAQKIAARFYKDATEKAFDELTDAILLRGKT